MEWGGGNKGVIWIINHAENSSFLKAACLFHSLQANCFTWKLNSAREKLSNSFKQMTLLNILGMKKMQSINHSKCNSHPPLTVGRSIEM